MDNNLIRLLYISESVEPITVASVNPILEVSRENNPKAKICGLLCYGTQYFVQFLEGNELDVMSLYLKITKDTRHMDCRILHITTIKERLFKDWSMGALQAKDCNMIDFDDLAGIKDRFSSERNPVEVIQALLATLRSKGSGS